MTAELHFLTAPAATAFEASLAARGAQLIAAKKDGVTPTRWTILSQALEPHVKDHTLLMVSFTRFDIINSLWTYQSGSRKVHVTL